MLVATHECKFSLSCRHKKATRGNHFEANNESLRISTRSANADSVLHDNCKSSCKVPGRLSSNSPSGLGIKIDESPIENLVDY